MENNEKTTEVINDLIEVNNDRINGFEKASKDLDEGNQDLKAVFDRLAGESRNNVSELRGLAGASADTNPGTSVLGAIHRAWIDVKAAFGGDDRKSILNECERGEDAIKKAYQTALEDSNELSANASAVISRQQQQVVAGHNEIRSLRDSA